MCVLYFLLVITRVLYWRALFPLPEQKHLLRPLQGDAARCKNGNHILQQNQHFSLVMFVYHQNYLSYWKYPTLQSTSHSKHHTQFHTTIQIYTHRHRGFHSPHRCKCTCAAQTHNQSNLSHAPSARAIVVTVVVVNDERAKGCNVCKRMCAPETIGWHVIYGSSMHACVCACCGPGQNACAAKERNMLPFIVRVRRAPACVCAVNNVGHT